MWDINLPHEVQNLKKHIEMRQELAEKMKSFSLDWKVTLQVPFSFLVFHPSLLCNIYNFLLLGFLTKNQEENCHERGSWYS